MNPAWVQAGRITSQVFKPTRKDNQRLSVYDGDQVSAKESWMHYTEELRYLSVGVVAVAVGECQELSLATEPDPEPFPAHVVIKFNGRSNSEIERAATRLRKFAVERGWQFRAEIER